MKSLFLFILIFSPFFHSIAQDVNSLAKEGARLEDLPDETAAFHKYREILKIQPQNIHALNKCSELCSRIGKRQTNSKLRDDYYSAAKAYAGIALKINPANSESNCVMAMVLGRSSLSKSGKEKIANAKEVKKFVDLALKYDPQNYKAWHILARWHYEITNLSLLERAAVKLLYGGVPPASIKESIYAFEKARAISPGFILNYYELARAYRQIDRNDKAIACIRLMLTLPNQTEDDPEIKADGKKLLNVWK